MKNRKHYVRVRATGTTMRVKDFMRNNQGLFAHIQGIPTTFQIADVLFELGYVERANALGGKTVLYL